MTEREEGQGRRRTWPLIIGHRGASGRLPENTLAAFRAAMRDGADGLELDVRMSADGLPVVMHDATLFRTTRRRGSVGDCTAFELAGMPAVGRVRRTARLSPVPSPGDADLCVPTLERVIDLTAAAGSTLYVELKGRGDGGLEEAVAGMIRRFDCHGRVVVLSFNHASLRRIKQIDGRIDTSATIAPTLRQPRLSPERIVEMVERAGASSASLHMSLATRRRVEALGERGLGVAVWTVNGPRIARYLASLGVDAIITDFPDRLVAASERS